MTESIGNRAPVTYKQYPIVNDLDAFQGLTQELNRECVEWQEEKSKRRENRAYRSGLYNSLAMVM